MTNLVLLVIMFGILNGCVHSCPNRSLNQNTERPKRFIYTKLCPKPNISNRVLEAISTTRHRIPDIATITKCEDTLTDEPISKGSDTKTGDQDTKIPNSQDDIDEFESIENEKKESLKIWRSPKIENQNLPKLFILRSNTYKK